MADDRPDPSHPAAPPVPAPTREDRLAAKLRENLRRRKTQARDIDADADAGSRALPKSREKS